MYAQDKAADTLREFEQFMARTDTNNCKVIADWEKLKRLVSAPVADLVLSPLSAWRQARLDEELAEHPERRELLTKRQRR